MRQPDPIPPSEVARSDAYAELADALVKALGLGGRWITAIELRVAVGEVPRVVVTEQIQTEGAGRLALALRTAHLRVEPAIDEKERPHG